MGRRKQRPSFDPIYMKGEAPLNVRKAAGVTSLAIMGSRVMGLVREQVFAGMFGAGKLLDSYLAAFQLPNLLRDLFAEGALSTAFTTTFTKTWDREGPAPAWVLANLVITAMLVILGSICVVGILAAPWIVQVTNYGFHEVPGKFELTVRLTQLLFPFILFVSLAAVVMGILNSRFLFALPASASTVFNVVSILAGVGGAYLFDPQVDWLHPRFTERALDGLCLGVLLGGLAQLFMQVPSLLKLGYRFQWKFDLADERLRIVWTLMVPSVIAGAAVQVNVLVNGMFASEIDGARSWLNCAFRLMQFPIGVFGVAIAMVTLPSVARDQARNNLVAFGATVQKSLRLAFFLTIPSAIGLAALASPIIRVIYEHGQFDATATAQTALALQAYVGGLAAYAAIKVVVPCFYALNSPNIPLRVSLFGIGLNLVANFLLLKICHFGHVGLAATTSLVAVVNLLQLLYALRRQIDFGSAREWLHYLLCLSGGAMVCGGTALVVNDLTRPLQDHLLGQIFSLVLAVGASAGAYFGLCFWLKVEETEVAWGILRRKLKR